MTIELSTLSSESSVPDGDFLVEMGPGQPPKLVPRAVLYNAIIQLLAGSYAPVSHQHDISAVTSLQATLDGFDVRLDALEA